jgi:hypothetical protein
LSWENKTHFQNFVLVAPPKTPTTLEPPKISQPIRLLWETLEAWLPKFCSTIVVVSTIDLRGQQPMPRNSPTPLLLWKLCCPNFVVIVLPTTIDLWGIVAHLRKQYHYTFGCWKQSCSKQQIDLW